MAKERRESAPIKMVRPLPQGPEQAAVEQEVKYKFSSACRCPGCGGTDTFVTDTRANIRRWSCRTPGCCFNKTGWRGSWKEIGTPI